MGADDHELRLRPDLRHLGFKQPHALKHTFGAGSALTSASALKISPLFCSVLGDPPTAPDSLELRPALFLPRSFPLSTDGLCSV